MKTRRMQSITPSRYNVKPFFSTPIAVNYTTAYNSVNSLLRSCKNCRGQTLKPLIQCQKATKNVPINGQAFIKLQKLNILAIRETSLFTQETFPILNSLADLHFMPR
jgi:hypothetical protein